MKRLIKRMIDYIIPLGLFEVPEYVVYGIVVRALNNQSRSSRLKTIGQLQDQGDSFHPSKQGQSNKYQELLGTYWQKFNCLQWLYSLETVEPHLYELIPKKIQSLLNILKFIQVIYLLKRFSSQPQQMTLKGQIKKHFNKSS